MAVEIAELVKARCSPRWYRSLGPVSDGVFIYSSELVHVSRTWASQLRRSRTGELRSARELLQTLHDAIGANESYLYDEGKVTPGFVAGVARGLAALPLRSTAWYIDPGDEAFRAPGMRVLDRLRCRIAVERKGKEVAIRNHAWRQFHARVGAVASVVKDHGSHLKSRRCSLRLLARLFRSSFPVRRKNAVMQFFRNAMRPASYYTNSGWVFVVEHPGELATCYHKGAIAEAGYTVTDEVDDE